MIADIALHDGAEVEVLVPAPCRLVRKKMRMPDGSPRWAKEQGCQNTPENVRPIIFTPVYECDRFGRCAPFAAKIEDEMDPTCPCRNCDHYATITQ